MRSLAATCISILTINAAAQDLTTRVRNDAKFTYADLLRQICPDLEINKDDPNTGSASKTIPIRSFYSKDTPDAWEAPIKVEGVATLDAKIAGRPQLLLMFDIKPAEGPDRPTRELALFDLSAAPKLLDVVESPSNPDDPGSLWANGPLHLSPKSDALVFETNHSNSTQSYQAFTILFANRGRIQQIENVMLLSCHYCNSGAFRESATIVTAPDPAGAMNQIIVRVVLKRFPDPDYVEHPRRTRSSTRVFSTNYRWNATKQKYVAASTPLRTLEVFNRKNY